MKRRDFLAAGLATTGACWLGCGGGQAEQGRLFGVTFQTMNNWFFVALNEGIKKVVEAHGDRLVTLDAQFDSLKQKNDVSDLIIQRAAAIFINPVNWKGIRGSLVEAQKKNIPVIVIDAPAEDTDLITCTVASDNVEAGRMAARALLKARPDPKVAVLHLHGNKACIDRVTGFTEELRKRGVEVLVELEGKGTREGARPVMLDLLDSRPELNAVFPINDPSAIGAILALEKRGKLKDVGVVSVDGAPDAIAAIREGKMLSTSAQFPEEIGRVAAEKAYEHIEGKTIEKDIKIRVELITKENVGKFSQRAKPVGAGKE